MKIEKAYCVWMLEFTICTVMFWQLVLKLKISLKAILICIAYVFMLLQTTHLTAFI